MSLFRKIVTGAAALAAGAVAACDQAPTSRILHVRPGGVRDFMTYAASRGPLLVETVQESFADRAAAAGVVAEAVAGGITGRVVRGTPEASAAPGAETRVRVALDAAADVQAGRVLCRGETPALTPGGDKMTALMAFCVKGEMEALVFGAIPRPAGPEDKAFAELMKQMSRQMFDKPVGS